MRGDFAATSYDPWAVLVSILIAILASYVALDLMKRLAARDGMIARAWWIGGSVVLGTGIWAMHFVGMVAYELPFALGYTRLLTFVSWVAAVGVSAAALAISNTRRLSAGPLIGGSLTMGAGICAMHYVGMAAIDVRPGIVWNLGWVAASAVIAVVISGVALTIFCLLRRAPARRAFLLQCCAAVVLGLAISGMHYAGMAGAGFAADSVCLSADGLSGNRLVGLITIATVLLLGVTLWTSIVDARNGVTAQLAASLQAANEQLARANVELKTRALLDPLTDLPNRLLFEASLDRAAARVARAAAFCTDRATARLGLLFVDLDRFKTVNDLLGHAAGDAVLKEAARRLRETARESDTVARIGGDEFLLLAEDVGEVADCIAVARRLVAALALPFETPTQTVLISASIGIVLHSADSPHDKLIANADVAMYAAKRAGGNTYVVFESHMDAGAVEQFRLQQDLRQALELGQMQLHYQPKIDGLSGQPSGVEALLRWTHPERGMVSPAEFIPLAERFGLIGGLGAWVVEEACRQMRAWADEGVRIAVAVNVSVHQLREDDFVERIRMSLERHRIEPSQLLCEITESVVMGDVRATQRTFESLSGLGVFLSIDDFGTGHSSLSYLRQLPASQLKIDRSFINDIPSSKDARAIVDAVVRLAHALGLRVVAEGVETAGQRDVLLALGCDELQGYFFGRPMPAGKLLAWLGSHAPLDALGPERSTRGAPAMV